LLTYDLVSPANPSKQKRTGGIQIQRDSDRVGPVPTGRFETIKRPAGRNRPYLLTYDLVSPANPTKQKRIGFIEIQRDSGVE
jgi:hypothetical protein